MKIAELPFEERPLLELLGFDLREDGRRDVDRDYAGYGWARADEIWLGEERVTDALVLALHSADDGEQLSDDIELELELPGGEAITVLASQFLDTWLPALPKASAIVLALCNPHRARLRYPAAAAAPLYVATGDVEAWLDDRVELIANGSWTRLPS